MTDRSCPVEFVELAERMADAARQVISPLFRSVAAEIKADASPVTVADRETERVLRQLIEESFPDHEIAGEEWGKKSTGSEWCWHLDPIDGTKSFAAGSLGFGCLIALARNGEPVLGLLEQPILRERWLAHGEEPTTLNGKAIETAKNTPIEQAIFHTSGMDYFPPDECAVVEALIEKCWFQRMSLDCYGYGLVAAGHIHYSLDGMVNAYDIAALIPIIRNAGGRISDWRGKDIVLADKIPNVIASANEALHEIALDTLSPRIP